MSQPSTTKPWIDIIDASGKRAGTLTPQYREVLNKMVVYLTLFDPLSDADKQKLYKIGFRPVKKQTNAGHNLLGTDQFAGEAKPGQKENRTIAIKKDVREGIMEVFPKSVFGAPMDYFNEIENFDFGSPVIQAANERNEAQAKMESAIVDDMERLGLNSDGLTVFEFNDERYVEHKDGKLLKCSNPSDPAALRIPYTYTQSDIAKIAKGVAIDARKNMSFNATDLDRYVSALSRSTNDQSAVRQVVSQVLIGDAANRLFLSNLNNSAEVQQANEYLSRLPVEISSGSMLPTTAAAASKLFSIKGANGRAMVPLNAGNGLGVHLFAKMGIKNISAYDPIGVIPTDFKQVRSGAVDVSADALEPEVSDMMLVEAHDGQLENPVTRDEYLFEKQQELAIFNALNGLAEDGYAVAQFPSMGAERDREFLNHLQTLFAVEAATRLQGDTFLSADDQILLVVKGRRLTQDNSLVFDKSISVKHDPIDVYDWLTQVAQQEKAQLKAASAEQLMSQEAERESLSAIATQITESHRTANEKEKYTTTHQAPYTPLSGASSSLQTYVPRGLSRATTIGQAKLRRGLDILGFNSVQEFLSDRLNIDLAKLDNEMVFGKHQLDQAAMTIVNYELYGQSMLIGSGTGVGKTRIMALVGTYHLERGMPLYVTGDKTAIFQKFMDEMSVIGKQHLVKPFILNHNCRIFDENGAEMDFAHTTRMYELTDQGLTPGDVGANTVFGTILQTAREVPKHPNLNESPDDFELRKGRNKRGWMMKWFKQCADMGTPVAMLQDESHNSAGQSKSFEATSELQSLSGHQTYFSGTALPTVHGFMLYQTCFPEAFDRSRLPQVLAQGGAPMSEAIITALTESGAYVRTELLDYKVFKLEEPLDPALSKFNQDSAGKLAVLLDMLSILSGEKNAAVNDEVEKLNAVALQKDPNAMPKSPRELGMESMHFASQLNHYIEQILLGHVQQQAVMSTIKSVKEDGKRVVLACQHTGDSIIQRIQERFKKEYAEGTMPTPTIRHVLQEALESTWKVSVREGRRGQFVTKDIRDRMGAQQLQQFNSLYSKAVDYLNNEIPEVPFAPIDYIREALASEGITMAEISGRSTRLTGVYNSSTATVTPQKINIEQAVRDFHDGKADVALITQSGASCIDLNHQPNTPSNKPVVLKIMQLNNNPVSVIQTAGRVDRAGQVTVPELQVLHPKLPAIERQYQHALKNVAFVQSANTGNANSDMMTDLKKDGEVNLFSDPGIKAVVQYLMFNPELARKLHLTEEISPLAADTEATISYSAGMNITSRFMSRLMMVPPIVAEQAIQDTIEIANSIYREQRAMGIDKVGGVQFMDVKGFIKSREVILPATDPSLRDDPLLGDVRVYEVEYPVTTKPYDIDAVLELIDIGKQRIHSKTGFGSEGLDAAAELLREQYPKIMLNTLPMGTVDKLRSKGSDFDDIQAEVNAILAAKGDDNRYGNNAYVRYIHEVLTWLQDNMPLLRPGGVATFQTANAFQPITGVIVDVERPRPGSEGILPAWKIKVAEPGAIGTRTISLLDVYKSTSDKVLEIEEFSDMHLLADEFDEQAEAKSDTQTMLVLGGNMPGAATLLLQQGGGEAIAYTDNNGVLRRGFKLPEKMTIKELRNSQQPFTDVNLAASYLRDSGMHYISTSTKYIPNRHAQISRDDSNAYVLHVPRNKTHGPIYTGKTYEKETDTGHLGATMVKVATEIEHLTGTDLSSSRNHSSLTIPDEKLEEVLEFLSEKVKYRDDEELYGAKGTTEWMAKYREQQLKEAEKMSAMSKTKDADDASKVNNNSSLQRSA